ncbi:MAG: GntR family transcriptional regulator [Phycisphaerales bacterium]|jgi:DNA-binding LacI/PurR family transcriptional regulator|nr:GntR family transcriptional regulator [Phycisphaerales bacterium]
MTPASTLYKHCLNKIHQSGDVRILMESEWELSRRFGVSRSAARLVMQRLVREGLIVAVRGKGYFTRPPPADPREARMRIGVVYEQSRGLYARLQNDILTGLLDAHRQQGLHSALLQIPNAADRSTIGRLIQSQKVDGYLLYSLPLAVQSQFAAQGKPAVVFGNTYDELGLPSVALDELDITRQLCDDLLKSGRRCVALIQERSLNLGAERSRLGFEYAHHARRRRFGRDRIILVDRHRGINASLRHLELLNPSAILVQNGQLMRQLWDNAGESLRQRLADAQIILLSGTPGNLPLHHVRYVKADLNAAARIVAKTLRLSLAGQRRQLQHHVVRWNLESA